MFMPFSFCMTFTIASLKSHERERIRALEAIETKSDYFYSSQVGGHVIEGDDLSSYGFKPDGKYVRYIRLSRSF